MSEAEVPLQSELQLAEAEIANLQLGLERRSMTSAAVGILMERYDVDYATAFATLVRVSNTRNVRLFDLAIELMDTGHLEGLPDQDQRSANKRRQSGPRPSWMARPRSPDQP
jgi:hypothetical protein